MAEYIEREAALNVLNGWRDQLILTYGKNDEYVKCLEIAAEYLESLHAADVRPVVRGKWTLNKDGSGTCSECGFVQNSCWDLDNWDNFCHHCGAWMEES